jgi:hypothetical protein
MIRKVFTKLRRRWRLMGTYVNTVLLDRRKVDRAYLLNGSMPLAAVSGAAEVGKGKSTELGGPGMGHLRALP